MRHWWADRLRLELFPAFAAHIFGDEPEREPDQQGNYYKVVELADYGNKIGDEVYGTGKVCERTSHQNLGNTRCALMHGQRFIVSDFPFNFCGCFFEHKISFYET